MRGVGGSHFAGGSFSEKGVLPRGSFFEKWYKEIFSPYCSEEIGVRYTVKPALSGFCIKRTHSTKQTVA